MNNLKVIKSLKQYHQYCSELERLTSLVENTGKDNEMIELLTLLIDKWDEEHNEATDINPVEMLSHLMKIHEINANELSKKSGVDKTVLSKILNFKKGFSKEVIRTLSEYFKVNQEVFNKPYQLIDNTEIKTPFKGTLTRIIQAVDKKEEIVDSLRIIPSKKSISISVTTLELRSKDDEDLILYIPSLKLYGKSKTHRKAKDHLDQEVERVLKGLLKLSTTKLILELKRLGWKQNKIKTKNFSNSYIDNDGALKGFDIPVEDKIIQKKSELFAV